MTRDDVIRWAREVWGQSAVLPFDELERFAALVAAAEREACANVCDALIEQRRGRSLSFDMIAAAIRARSKLY